MAYNRKAVLFFLVVLGAVVAVTATANAAQQWDVPDYTTLSVKATTGPVETETSFREALEENFAGMDTNSDGFVSYAEAQAALPGMTQDVFYAVDTNGDGKVSHEEAEAGSGCAGCSCSRCDFSKDGIQKHLGNLFLAGLSLSVLAGFSRRFK